MWLNGHEHNSQPKVLGVLRPKCARASLRDINFIDGTIHLLVHSRLAFLSHLSSSWCSVQFVPHEVQLIPCVSFFIISSSS